MNRRHFTRLLGTGMIGGLSACSKQATTNADGKPIIRIGHFPNVTHVQALVAHQLSRQGKGWFEERLGAEIQWYLYNAGPSATEAIFARSIDLTYIGPSPVLNAYSKSKGSEIRVLAGAATGGSALVVRTDSGIQTPADFKGKKIASPQLGNTQDVQLRAWLVENGHKVTLTGGDVNVVPTENADQLSLLQKKELDGAWTAEPWVTRLELEAGAKVFLQDKDTNVTLLVARAAWLAENAELAKKVVAAHKELTAWVLAHPGEAKALVKAELTEALHKAPSDELLDRSLSRVVISDAVSRESLEKMVASAKSAGFLADIPDLGNLLPSL